MKPQEAMAGIQYLNKYARYDHALGKREQWGETVERVLDYLMEVGGDAIPEDVYKEIGVAIFSQEVSPSMRLMATAGVAAKKNPISIYNCVYMPLETTTDIHDLSMALGHGSGVGFSVEGEFVGQWPKLPDALDGTYTIIVSDDIEGWSISFQALIDNFLNGYSTIFDYSLVRPKGAPLLTRGGTASGPGPLMDAHVAITAILNKRLGKHLRSIDLFDIACHVAKSIVSGGVRRSAMIAIFDAEDELMFSAKSGDWWKDNLQRSLANISQVVDSHWTLEQWRRYVEIMDANKSGEPGIWSRYAIKKSLPHRRQFHKQMGPNPCVEQILRPRQFCNLSQAIVRQDDTVEDIERKVALAAIVGTIQSSLTDFQGINDGFKANCDDERLLGVSLAGIMDCPLLSTGNPELLERLTKVVIKTNRKYAKLLGINPSTSTTCIKPDGNSSVFYDTAPGMHGRYAPFYIRRMEMQFGSPVANFAIASRIPAEPKFGETWDNINTVVLSFPVKSPDGAIIQRDRGAIEQLNTWLNFKKYYTETNPSVTIMYRNDELDDIAKWLFENQNETVGLSFLPADDHTYEQAPYQEITEEEYNEMVYSFPEVNFDEFWKWEVNTDTTEAAMNLACTGGSCLI